MIVSRQRDSRGVEQDDKRPDGEEWEEREDEPTLKSSSLPERER